jgi:cell division protease FtsH
LNSRNQSYIVYILLLVAIVALVLVNINRSASNQDVLTINEVASDIKKGLVGKVVEEENKLTIVYKDGTEKTSNKEVDATLVQQLIDLGVTPEELSPDKGIKVDIRPPSQMLDILTILGYALPFLFLAGALWFIFRQAQGSNNAAMSFGKSRARMFTGENPSVTFQDVAGVEEAKEELQEVVEFLREPQKFRMLGARIPKGVLLVGPPGTGKTLMAKAVSGEAGVPFFSISGSEFVEMFVGVGASRVRDLFEQAKRHSPCIVFVDEIDAVGRQRGAGLGGSHDEREQTLNQLLVEMDGFDTDTSIIIMAATNRPDILDPALLRPGRFDRRVVLDKPDAKGREAILKVHARGKPISPDVDFALISRTTAGMAGADLENLVNEAAILAARRSKKVITQTEFMESIERVMLGPERKSRVISPEEKRIFAYHEAGHAILHHVIADADPVQKISIISRGMAGGFTLPVPQEERGLWGRKKLTTEIITLLGGRAAEELIFDDISTGAANDIERVTELARTMVTRLGMSGELGPMVFGQKQELVFLGREISEQRDYSEAVAQRIDQEVRDLVQQSYIRAKELLVQYQPQLQAVADKLLEVETLSREEFEQIFPVPVTKVSGTPQPK